MNVELAEKVKKAILAEPKQVNMNTFCRFDNKFEKCDTVGCIAGHVLFESGLKDYLRKSSFIDYRMTAAGLLGIPLEEANMLFYFFEADENSIEDCAQEYLDLGEELKEYTIGTKGYAKVVAKAIDLCIQRMGED